MRSRCADSGSTGGRPSGVVSSASNKARNNGLISSTSHFPQLGASQAWRYTVLNSASSMSVMLCCMSAGTHSARDGGTM